jgi:L-fucose mutarotase
MRPDDGTTPAAFGQYKELLGGQFPLEKLGRHQFYAACREPDLAICVATGDARLYANLLLTIGIVPPA